MLAIGAILLTLLGACAPVATPLPTPTSTPTPSPSPTATPSPSPTPTPTLSPTPTPTPLPTPVPTPTPIPLDEALLHSRLTVLVIGTDANSRRRRSGADVNTDSMIVASIAPDGSRIDSVSLPRDTVDVPMPDGSIYPGKINALHRTAGPAGLRDAFESLYGIDIDYYASINMDDMAHLVDAVGGVDVEVPYAFSDGPLGFSVAAGWQHLDGNGALQYTRSRYADGDHARALRQQQILVALALKLADPATSFDVFAFAGSHGSLQTDIPFDKLPTFREIGRRAVGAQVVREVLGPPTYALFEGFDGARGWVMIPNIPAMRGYVQAVMGGG
jgi:LCP family protein required for cell wall assembly